MWLNLLCKSSFMPSLPSSLPILISLASTTLAAECVFKLLAGRRRSLLQSLLTSYPHARVREKREEKEQSRRISRLLLSLSSSLLYVSAPKMDEIAHYLQVSRQRFASSVLSQLFLLNLFVLSSCLCIILSRMCCLHREELLSFTLPENCILEIEGRSYRRKTFSQTCQNGWFLIYFKWYTVDYWNEVLNSVWWFFTLYSCCLSLNDTNMLLTYIIFNINILKSTYMSVIIYGYILQAWDFLHISN